MGFWTRVRLPSTPFESKQSNTQSCLVLTQVHYSGDVAQLGEHLLDV